MGSRSAKLASAVEQRQRIVLLGGRGGHLKGHLAALVVHAAVQRVAHDTARRTVAGTPAVAASAAVQADLSTHQSPQRSMAARQQNDAMGQCVSGMRTRFWRSTQHCSEQPCGLWASRRAQSLGSKHEARRHGEQPTFTVEVRDRWRAHLREVRVQALQAASARHQHGGRQLRRDETLGTQWLLRPRQLVADLLRIHQHPTSGSFYT